MAHWIEVQLDLVEILLHMVWTQSVACRRWTSTILAVGPAGPFFKMFSESTGPCNWPKSAYVCSHQVLLHKIIQYPFCLGGFICLHASGFLIWAQFFVVLFLRFSIKVIFDLATPTTQNGMVTVSRPDTNAKFYFKPWTAFHFVV